MARIISIDLGAYAVKVSVLSGSGSDDTVVAEVSQRVPADPGLVPTLDERLAALDLLLSTHPDLMAGSHQAVVAWPSDLATIHRLELPFGDDSQVAQTLPFAVESEVPFDLDSMALAWRRGDEGHVLVTLARSADLEMLLEGLAARGLDPRRVIPEGEALAVWAHDPAQVTAVIDVGYAKTTVVVARDGKALLSRAVGLGGRAFAAAIMASLSCSDAEAEALLRGGTDDLDGLLMEPDTSPMGPVDGADEPSTAVTRPRLDTLPPKALEALHATMGLLLAEIRSTLVHAEDELGLGVDAVVLSGGASRAADFAEFLHNDLGVPVLRATEDDIEIADVRAVARGAAASFVTGDSGATDLRVGELAWRGGMATTRMVLSYGGVLLSAFSVCVLLMFAYKYHSLSSELSEIESRTRVVVAAITPELTDEISTPNAVELLAGTLDDARSQANFLGDANSAPPIVDLLSKITDHFPPPDQVTVRVDTLEITPNTVQIDGSTDGFAQVDKIGEGLTNSGLFPSVVTSPGNKDNQGKLNFKVSIQRTDADADDTDAPAGEEG